MSFKKYKSDCVGGRHQSSTVKFYGDKTCKCSKVLIGHCSICNRKNLRLLGKILYKQKVLVTFSRNYVKKHLMYQKNGKKRFK